MVHQMEQKGGTLRPSAMIRFGPHWHSCKMTAKIVNAVLDAGTKKLYNQVLRIIKQGNYFKHFGAIENTLSQETSKQNVMVKHSQVLSTSRSEAIQLG